MSFANRTYCSKVSANNGGKINEIETTKLGKTEVDFDEFEKYRLSGTALIVDVRNLQELQENGEVPNAINIPLPHIPIAFHGQMDAEDFENEFGVKKPTTDDAVIFFCKKGIRADMARKLVSLQSPPGHIYKNVASYPGSFDEWSEMHRQKDN